MARSRSPDGRERSQESSSAVTSAAAIVAGSRVSRQPATGGIAVPRSVAVMPFKYRNRSSDRRSAASRLADPVVLRREQHSTR